MYFFRSSLRDTMHCKDLREKIFPYENFCGTLWKKFARDFPFQEIRQNKKRAFSRFRENALSFFVWCGGGESNPHENYLTRSLVLRVCQFRHLRVTKGIITRDYFASSPKRRIFCKFSGKFFAILFGFQRLFLHPFDVMPREGNCAEETAKVG